MAARLAQLPIAGLSRKHDILRSLDGGIQGVACLLEGNPKKTAKLQRILVDSKIRDQCSKLFTTLAVLAVFTCHVLAAFGLALKDEAI